MKIVLDTNVVVSGLLNPFGTPAKALHLVLSREVGLLVDQRILLEYRDVLTRGEFHFPRHDVTHLLDFFDAIGEPVMTEPLRTSMPDPDDAPFLEVARAGAADALVTGNARHYPAHLCGSLRVLSLAAFVRQWQQTPPRS